MSPELHEPVLTGEAGVAIVPGLPVGISLRAYASATEGAWYSSEPIQLEYGQTSYTRIEVPGEESLAIGGMVLDPTNQGVPDLTVAAWPAGGAPRVTGWECATDPAGRFLLPVGEDCAECDLELVDERRAFATVRLTKIKVGTGGLEVHVVPALTSTLRAAGQNQMLRGWEAWVLPETALVPGTARLRDTLTALRHCYSRALDSDRDGQEKIEIPDGPFCLLVSAAGFERRVAGPWAPGATPRDITVEMAELPVLRGRVVTSAGPVGGAIVSLHDFMGGKLPMYAEGMLFHATEPWVVTTSGEDGVFTLRMPKLRRALIRAEKEGCLGQVIIEDLVAAADGREVTVLMGSERGEVEGQVRSKKGRSVEYRVVGLTQGDGWLYTTRCDERGRFHFSNVAAGKWQCRVVSRDWSPQFPALRFVAGEAADDVSQLMVVGGSVTQTDVWCDG